MSTATIGIQFGDQGPPEAQPVVARVCTQRETEPGTLVTDQILVVNSVEAEIQGEVDRQLNEIERQCGVYVLNACESGSRAWGFAYSKAPSSALTSENE